MKYVVNMIEYERGWGSKLDEVLYFETETEAISYCEDYNARYNSEDKVPDWYIIARYMGKQAEETKNEVKSNIQ